MFMVYWTEVHEKERTPKCKEFCTEGMTQALNFLESLRKKQRENGDIFHITMSAENPHSVGLPGVAETGPDYNWKKRRI